jgi:protein-tyrosine phosphatase
MTGGRSPSSPWVQSPQASHRDGVTQSFQSTISPSQSQSHTSIMSNAAFTDRSSPNYFGMVSHNPSQQTSNPGLSAQKNRGTSSQTQSVHSPKPHLHPQEMVSSGLMNMLKTEPETSRIRRESALNESSNGNQTSPPARPSPSYPVGSFSFGQSTGQKLGAGKNSMSAPQGNLHLRRS